MLIKIKEKIDINAPGNVAEIFQKILATENEIDREKEHFWAVGITTRNTIKYIELVSLGTLEASLVHPRETFRLAILKAASRIIVAHNHPSETLAPSEEDIKITKRLVDAGNIIGITVLDHVIVTKGGYTSMHEQGYI
ncbi:MAG: JAB domain-containing protein [Thermoplasmatota archaeon]